MFELYELLCHFTLKFYLKKFFYLTAPLCVTVLAFCGCRNAVIFHCWYLRLSHSSTPITCTRFSTIFFMPYFCAPSVFHLIFHVLLLFALWISHFVCPVSTKWFPSKRAQVEIIKKLNIMPKVCKAAAWIVWAMPTNWFFMANRLRLCAFFNFFLVYLIALSFYFRFPYIPCGVVSIVTFVTLHLRTFTFTFSLSFWLSRRPLPVVWGY